MEWNKYVSIGDIKSFISKRYNLKVTETKELEGYEDFNLQVHAYRAKEVHLETATGESVQDTSENSSSVSRKGIDEVESKDAKGMKIENGNKILQITSENLDKNRECGTNSTEYETENKRTAGDITTRANINLEAKMTYVLKISHVSTRANTLELQNEMLLFLSKHGIQTCVPLPSTRGQYTELLTSSKDSKLTFHTRILHYVHGVTFVDAGKPLYMLQPVGELVGKMCHVLKSFTFENYKPSTSLFELSRASEIETHIQRHYQGDRKEMAMEILQEYRTKIRPVEHKLQKGFIHGDINSRNIILSRKKHNSHIDYVVAGIIDFGDACKSFYLYEIAVAMADIFATCYQCINPLVAGKNLFAGIIQHFTLTELELSLLKLTICVRLLQVHVLIEDLIKGKITQTNLGYLEKCRNNFMEVCEVLWYTDESIFLDTVSKEP